MTIAQAVAFALAFWGFNGPTFTATVAEPPPGVSTAQHAWVVSSEWPNHCEIGIIPAAVAEPWFLKHRILREVGQCLGVPRRTREDPDYRRSVMGGGGGVLPGDRLALIEARPPMPHRAVVLALAR